MKAIETHIKFRSINKLMIIPVLILAVTGCGGIAETYKTDSSQGSVQPTSIGIAATSSSLQINQPSSNTSVITLPSKDSPSTSSAASASKQNTSSITNAASPLILASVNELIFDSRKINIPNVGVYPEKGIEIQDPVVKFISKRMTDVSELTGDYLNQRSDQSLVVYSRYSPENSNGELFVVHGTNSTSAWVYGRADKKLIAPLKFNPNLGSDSRSLGEINELRWDYTGQHPNRLYFVGRSLPTSQSVSGENPGMSFYYIEIDPASNTHTTPILIRDFTRDFPSFPNGLIMNDVEGDSSNDSRYWAWQVINPLGSGYKTYGVFSYDKNADKILGKLQRSCVNETAPCVSINVATESAPYITRPNMVEFSPLGTRVIVHFERIPPGYGRDADMNSVVDGPKAFYPNFTDPVRISADATHSGWAWGTRGEELFVSQNNRNDWIEAVDISSESTAKCVLIGGAGNSYSCGIKVISQPQLDPTYAIGYHFGKVYDQNKRGWFFISTYGLNDTAWSVNQLMFVKISDAATGFSPTYARVGSSLNKYYDYRSEGSAALGFKGNRIWSTANWGFSDGRGEVVQIDVPDNIFEMLSR